MAGSGPADPDAVHPEQEEALRSIVRSACLPRAPLSGFSAGGNCSGLASYRPAGHRATFVTHCRTLIPTYSPCLSLSPLAA